MEDFRATAASKATTMGHIQRHHLARVMTIVPSDPVIKAANQLITPLF
jgi:type I restriction enzyme S subunit